MTFSDLSQEVKTESVGSLWAFLEDLQHNRAWGEIITSLHNKKWLFLHNTQTSDFFETSWQIQVKWKFQHHRTSNKRFVFTDPVDRDGSCTWQYWKSHVATVTFCSEISLPGCCSKNKSMAGLVACQQGVKWSRKWTSMGIHVTRTPDTLRAVIYSAGEEPFCAISVCPDYVSISPFPVFPQAYDSRHPCFLSPWQQPYFWVGKKRRSALGGGWRGRRRGAAFCQLHRDLKGRHLSASQSAGFNKQLRSPHSATIIADRSSPHAESELLQSGLKKKTSSKTDKEVCKWVMIRDQGQLM